MHPLILKYFNQTISPLEKEILFDALDKDPALKQEFIELQACASLTTLLPAEAAQKSANEKTTKRFLRVSGRLVRYAAAAVLLLVTTWALVHTLRPLDSVAFSESEAMATLTALAGQRISITLQDGTQVWLNSNSTLHYPKHFDKTARRVELDGEAYFDVAPNKKHPFIVETERYNIEVLGTEFNVMAYKGSPIFKTSLLEGAVKIYDPDNKAIAIHLEPSQEATISEAEGELAVNTFTDTSFLRWKEGIYAFDDCTFAQIIDHLQHYYGVPIRIEDDRLAQFRISGKFRLQDGLDNALKNMQRVTRFKYKTDPQTDTLIIK